jgi:carboxyl-terminal processing protease
LDFNDHPVDALILDLRGNPGGLLTAAVEICDMFIDRGTIVSTRGRGRTVKSKYEANPENTIVPKEMPVVVLTNGASASASEIVAACLQDHKRAVVVGARSFGKGTVQNVIRLEGGKSALKLTTASYWRPSGKNIHRGENATDDQDWGVRPNKGFEVKLDAEEVERLLRARRDRDILPVVDSDGQPPPREDPQLDKAVEYLQQQLAEPAVKTKKA